MWNAWTSASTNGRLEELDLFTVDRDRVLVNEFGLSKHNIDTMLLAEVLCRVMMRYLSTNFAHSLHNLTKVHFNFALYLNAIFCACSQLVCDVG